MAVGFYFDQTRCTGCRACQVACKDKNRLEVGYIFRNAHTYTVGSFPDVKGYSFSTSCNHCDNAACVEQCPTGAMYKADDGTTIVDKEVCIGCGTCVEACPYGVPVLLPEKISGKCDGCYAIRQAGGVNACVAACPNRALDFGDVDELKQKYGSDLVTAIPVHPDGGTSPNFYINAKDVATEENYTEVTW
jgi:anaerobic dimethyl sulfoxide reductase subunit B (iron-sulfur subunit)